MCGSSSKWWPSSIQEGSEVIYHPLNVVMLQSTLWTLFNNSLEAECFAAIPKDHEAPLVKTNGSAFTAARLQSRTCASLTVYRAAVTSYSRQITGYRAAVTS